MLLHESQYLVMAVRAAPSAAIAQPAIPATFHG